jgi:hypothetical protein
VIPIDNLSNLPKTTAETAVVIIPYTQIAELELSQIGTYVRNGGTLVLFDDYGYGNQILSSLDAEIKFSGKPLIDPLFNYNTKTLPKIADFTADKITTNVSSIVLNHAQTLK